MNELQTKWNLNAQTETVTEVSTLNLSGIPLHKDPQQWNLKCACENEWTKIENSHRDFDCFFCVYKFWFGEHVFNSNVVISEVEGAAAIDIIKRNEA